MMWLSSRPHSLTVALPIDPAVRRQNPMSPGGAAGGPGGSGFCATIASVVISRPATEAASCSAVRTTSDR